MVPNMVPRRSEPSKNPMDGVVEKAKAALLMEYEHVGAVDIAVWVSRYPEHRDELIDFWMWVKGTPRSAEMTGAPFPAADSDVIESALRDACLAVNLGRQWMEAPVDPSTMVVQEMARALDAIRAKPRLKGGKAPVGFRRAVVWTWIVCLFQDRRSHASRLAVQKVTYLLENAMNLGLFTEHTRKPLGPYDHKARYRDAEPIAVKKGWLDVQGTTLRATEKASEVQRFVGRYLRSEALAAQVVRYLVGFSDEELEVIATVHWTVKELTNLGRVVSVAAIVSALAETPQWQAKLQRQAYSATLLGVALRRLQELRLAPTQ